MAIKRYKPIPKKRKKLRRGEPTRDEKNAIFAITLIVFVAVLDFLVVVPTIMVILFTSKVSALEVSGRWIIAAGVVMYAILLGCIIRSLFHLKRGE